MNPPVIDKEAIRLKYLAERDKRLRADGNNQYLEIAGQFSHYLDDPYMPVIERAPKSDHVQFAFIGGGVLIRYFGLPPTFANPCRFGKGKGEKTF